MVNIEFVIHPDCEIPCLHIVITENGQVVTDTEAQLSDYINIIPLEKLQQYSIALGEGFQRIIDIISSSDYNINVFNAKIQDMIAISKKKTEVDTILNPPQTEAENNNV